MLVGLVSIIIACAYGGKRGAALEALAIASIAAAETAARRRAAATRAARNSSNGSHASSSYLDVAKSSAAEQALQSMPGVIEIIEANIRDSFDHLHAWAGNILHVLITCVTLAGQLLWAIGMCVAVIRSAPGTGLYLEPVFTAGLFVAHIVVGAFLAGACARVVKRSASPSSSPSKKAESKGYATETSAAVGAASGPSPSAAAVAIAVSGGRSKSALGREEKASAALFIAVTECLASCCSATRARAALVGMVHPRLLVVGSSLTGFESSTGSRLAVLRGISMLTRDIPIVVLLGISPGSSTTSVVVLLMSSFMLFWDFLALVLHCSVALRRKAASRAARYTTTTTWEEKEEEMEEAARVQLAGNARPITTENMASSEALARHSRVARVLQSPGGATTTSTALHDTAAAAKASAAPAAVYTDTDLNHSWYAGAPMSFPPSAYVGGGDQDFEAAVARGDGGEEEEEEGDESRGHCRPWTHSAPSFQWINLLLDPLCYVLAVKQSLKPRDLGFFILLFSVFLLQ
jgi:hypothetical protein